MTWRRAWLPLLPLGVLAGLWALGPPAATRPRRPVPHRADGDLVFAGRVCDARGPLAGARVRFQGRAGSALTGADGRFRLTRPAGAARWTAWLDGYFIGGAPLDGPPEITLRPLPAEDCEAYAWVDPRPDRARPQNCANCHGDIYREWSLSGHARAAAGRHFLDLYEGTGRDGRKAGWSLLDDREAGGAVCVSCHAPTASLGPSFDLLGVAGVASQGVHCDYCHKVTDAGLGTVGLTHGRQGMKLLRPAEGQLFFGPLDDVDRDEDAYAPLYRDSKYCASCHEGNVFGVHVYSTYSEWRQSPAARRGRQCQTCHMAPTGRMTNVAPGRGGIDRDPQTLANHRFFAGSQEGMLRRCLHVDVTATAGDAAVRVEVVVRADDVGHRVPTGFVDRHLLLVVEGRDAAGGPAEPRAGPVLPGAAGRGLAGRPGRLYAKLLKDGRGRSPAPFWLAAPEFDDTRLSPEEPDRSAYLFPPETRQVRVRLLYRRFWQEVADVKGWADTETVVLERQVEVPQRDGRN